MSYLISSPIKIKTERVCFFGIITREEIDVLYSLGYETSDGFKLLSKNKKKITYHLTEDNQHIWCLWLSPSNYIQSNDLMRFKNQL